MSTDAPLEVDPARLPDDPAFLKHLAAQLFAELQRERGKLAKLQHHMDLLLRKIFGRSSEKLDPRQALLFEIAGGQTPPLPPPAAQPELPTSPRPAGKGHGRRRAPDTSSREVVTHDLTPEEKQALGGEANLIELPDEVTEQWEWNPSSLYVIEHHQKKYKLREPAAAEAPPADSPTMAEAPPPAGGAAGPEGSGAASPGPMLIVAKKPPQAIPGGVAGPGLLAAVIVNKADVHLPLNRQERIWARQGLKISRQTQCDWWLACAELFLPLVDVAKVEVMASQVVHIDETRVDIRDAHEKLQFQGHLWVRVGDLAHPLVVYDYTPDRSRDGPTRLLAGYRGYVQADAYSGYDGVYLESSGEILEVACHAHARRKFYEARRLDGRAHVALARIGQLYALEKELRESCQTEWRELPREEQYARIAARRQAEAKPLLSSFHEWLTAEAPKVLPQNPVRQAMEYYLNHWAAFCRYTEDGRLDIDNNEAERQMKPIAVGRKNWLFCGSERGARAAAVHFSLIASCRRHQVDAWAYLRDLLVRLPLLRDADQLTPEHLRPLLPHLWQPA
jgi:hypothetical protein